MSLRSHAIALDAADGLAVVGSIELSRSEDVLDGKRGEGEEDDREEHCKVEENYTVLELLLRLRILDLNLLLQHTSIVQHLPLYILPLQSLALTFSSFQITSTHLSGSRRNESALFSASSLLEPSSMNADTYLPLVLMMA